MSFSAARFSIVTPTLGDFTKLQLLKESLILQEDVEWDWFIMDTQGSEPPPETGFWSQDPRIHWVKCKSKNVNAARNLGAKRSTGPWLVFLDDDVALPNATHLKDRLRFHLMDREVILGGNYLSTPASLSFPDRLYNKMCNLWIQRFQISPHGPMLLGGNFSCSRRIFEDHQLIENIPWGGEELLSFLKWKRSGVHFKHWTQLSVEHAPGKSMISLIQTAWRQGSSKPMQKEIGVQLPIQTLVRLFFASGLYAPWIVLYWMIGEAARLRCSLELFLGRKVHEPASDNPVHTDPASST